MGFGKIIMGATALVASLFAATGGTMKSMPDGSAAHFSEVGAIKQDIGKAIAGKDPATGMNLREKGKRVANILRALNENDLDDRTEY